MEFASNDALVRWMEHEGLSPFTLLKATPKPGRKVPPWVTMEWGLEDLEHDGDREKFLAWRVTAEGVEVWRADGALDPFEECQVALGDGAGIDLRLEAGGSAHLRCARLVVADPVDRFRKGRPRPHHGEVSLERELTTVTVGDLRRWLGLGELTCRRHLSTAPLADGARLKDAKDAVFEDGADRDVVFASVNGERLTVSRGKWCPDATWTALWAAIRVIPGVTLLASRDLVAPPERWPAVPPPKPSPQVWPDVFGVTCDFAAMTLDDLRVCLGLPDQPFAFEAGGPEAAAGLTLERAADATGTFLDAKRRALFTGWINASEGSLSFRRARGCPDDVWRAVWRASLPGTTERHSRTTRSPPDPWPPEPPER